MNLLERLRKSFRKFQGKLLITLAGKRYKVIPTGFYNAKQSFIVEWHCTEEQFRSCFHMCDAPSKEALEEAINTGGSAHIVLGRDSSMVLVKLETLSEHL